MSETKLNVLGFTRCGLFKYCVNGEICGLKPKEQLTLLAVLCMRFLAQLNHEGEGKIWAVFAHQRNSHGSDNPCVWYSQA